MTKIYRTVLDGTEHLICEFCDKKIETKSRILAIATIIALIIGFFIGLLSEKII